MISALLISVIVLLLLRIIQLRYAKLSVLSKNGIPGPQPNLFFGNFNFTSKLFALKTNKLRKIYGDTFGFYFSTKPIIVTYDPELIKTVFVKNFAQFINRSNIQVFKDNLDDSFMIFLRDNEWRAMRTTLRASFSNVKLNPTIPIIQDSLQKLIADIDSNHGKGNAAIELNTFIRYKNMTLNSVARWAFGLRLDSNGSSKIVQKFLGYSDQLLKVPKNFFLRLFVMISIYLNEDKFASGIIQKLFSLIENPKRKIFDIGHALLDARMVSKTHREDLIQDTIDARVENLPVSLNLEPIVDSETGLATGKLRWTKEAINGVSCTMLVAGSETTSTALSFISNLLASHQEVQEKLREEVQSFWTAHPDPARLEAKHLATLEYMECVINEGLRLYPPATMFTAREAAVDFHYNDITIPKGAFVHVPTYWLQREPHIFPEPDKFIPERFADGEKYEPYFQPFGYGPRNCLGMRLAMVTMKLTLATLLAKYRIVKSPNVPELIDVEDKILTLGPKDNYSPVIFEPLAAMD